MAIENDQQLGDAVGRAGELLQDIQNYCGRENRVGARVRFPRGFLQTAVEYRRQLPRLQQPGLAQNISYALMTADLLAWLAIRTDLTGQAFEMVVKEGICIIGAICESLTVRRGVRGLGSNSSFSKRINRLVEIGVISTDTQLELDWVWGMRNREHLAHLVDTDYNQYTRADFNRARDAYLRLRDDLKVRYP